VSTKLHLHFMKTVFILVIVSLVMSMSVFPAHNVAAAKGPGGLENQIATLPTNQIIIQYKGLSEAYVHPDQAVQMQRLNTVAGAALQYGRAMSGNAHVLRLPGKLPLEQVRAITARLMALPDVEYAGPDQIMQHSIDSPGGAPTPALRPLMLTPNDPQYANQWDLKGTWGINAPAAWDTTTGSGSVVVAVIDTGITSHAEFSGRTVAGYDFIDDALVGNDGSGRDSDPSDPGDWITSADSSGSTYGGWFAGCYVSNSSWHGTHTAGTIGATGNNSLGVAGINWSSNILPVRVLGKCGGYLSDVLDGMRWAAGLPVSGVPANANPAKVLNLSLGGSGLCSSAFQTAINQINAAGSVVVVSAGNGNTNASNSSPANCNGVITVAATNVSGNRAYYSNYGAKVEISAPGGAQSFYNDPKGILSTLNTGLHGPVADTYVYYQGTSMAAPHVSGVASLLFSLKPSLTPGQVLQILQSTSKAFPAGGSCTTSLCGSGIVNAAAALAYPMMTISGNAGLVAGATLSYFDGVLKTVTVDGSGNYSFNVPYNWSGAVTPSDVRHVFTPDHMDYVNISADQAAQDYTAAPLWFISGNAGVAGATLSYNDGGAKSVTADGGGEYLLTVSDNYIGTVTVSRSGYTYTTDHIDYSNVLSDLTGQNYTPNETVHSLSGNVSADGATLSFNDGSPQTASSDSGGNYSLLVPDNFAGIVTPAKAGLIFTPVSKDYSSTPVTTDLTGQDYAATMTFMSSGTYDGWVLESTETSGAGGTMNSTATTFQLGDDAANRQYRTLLSFNTAGLPDGAIISSVLLEIKQSGAPVGSNPFNVLNNLLADIRMSKFGSAVSLQPGDFSTAAAATKVGTFGKTPVSGWYKAILNSAGRNNINRTGLTQLRLRFAMDDNNDLGADFMKFLSGNAASNKPVLIITYTLP